MLATDPGYGGEDHDEGIHLECFPTVVSFAGAAAASPETGERVERRLRGCEKTVASEGRSRCILGAPSRATPWPWLPAGAQDRFAGSETERKPRRGESQGRDEQPECMI